MEAEFSDSEFSEILGAFAKVDEFLIGWDVNTPLHDSEVSALFSEGFSDKRSTVPFASSHDDEALAERSLIFSSKSFSVDTAHAPLSQNISKRLNASCQGPGSPGSESTAPSVHSNHHQRQLQDRGRGTCAAASPSAGPDPGTLGLPTGLPYLAASLPGASGLMGQESCRTSFSQGQPLPQVPMQVPPPQLQSASLTARPGQVAPALVAASTGATWIQTTATAAPAAARGSDAITNWAMPDAAATPLALKAADAPQAAATTPAAGASSPNGRAGGSAVADLPVTGASMLAELVAEATSGGWSALGTGLPPLPAGNGRSAEELLAGLDLSEIFAPPKPSLAKRIRGHVRRAAELKAQLADRVRAIQRLAAENADLRSRARVIELVVRCRDDHLQLLRNYRTSADGKTFYVQQMSEGMARTGIRDSEAMGTAATAAAAGWGQQAVFSPVSPMSLGMLANMPASALLAMFRQLVSELTVSLAAVDAQGPTAGAAAAVSSWQTGSVIPERSLGSFGLRAAGAPALLPTHPTAVAELGAAAMSTCAASAGAPDHQAPQQHWGGAAAGAEAVPAPGESAPLRPAAGERGAAGLWAADGGYGAVGLAGGHVLGVCGAAAAPDAEPPLAQLRNQIARFRSMVRYLGLVNEEVCRFIDTTLNGDTAPPEPGHWLRVVQALELSQQQRVDAVALFACWQDWLGRIRAERRNIAAALDRLLSVNRYGNAYSESTGEYGTDRDVIHHMHANVMREKVLVVLVGEALCCHILTDIQWARAIVLSYPYVLDPRELLRATVQLCHLSIVRVADQPCVPAGTITTSDNTIPRTPFI